MTVEVRRRRFTVEEYQRMGETGILDEDERVELIEGEIVEMNPIGPLHGSVVARLVSLLVTRLGARAVPPRFVLVDSGLGVPRRRDGLMVGEERLTRAQCGTGQGGERLREFEGGG